MLRKEENVKRQHKRFGSTRHNRFGTLISVVKENDLRLSIPGQTALIKGQSHSLAKLDAAKKFHKPNRPVEVVRSFLVVLANQENDLDKPVQLTNEARVILGRFVTTFLETSFNRKSPNLKH
jgi:replication fork protection complex subunit Tof1/Swi1